MEQDDNRDILSNINKIENSVKKLKLEKEKEDYKKLRQEHSDAMTYDEKEEIKKLVEKLRKEDEEK